MTEKPLVFLLTARQSPDDAPLLQRLVRHFRAISTSVELWEPSQIKPGEDEAAARARKLGEADLVLAMVSSDTLADDSWADGVQQARKGGKPIIPIPLRASYWEESLVGGLGGLSEDKTPLEMAPNLDKACADIVAAVRKLVGSADLRLETGGSEPANASGETSYLQTREAYLGGIEDHLQDAHPLGLSADMPANKTTSLATLWTPVRAVRTAAVVSPLRETLTSILLQSSTSISGAARAGDRGPEIWHLLGDPGSGKSWAMLRAAADLAALARKDAACPLPLLVTARQLAGSENPRDGARNHPTTAGQEFIHLFDSPSERWIVLVDGLDEAGQPGNDAIVKLLRRLGPRLHALLVSSRPSFMPRVGLPTGELRLAAWTDGDVDDFLRRWEAVSPRAVARLREPAARRIAGTLLSSPQTATLCVLAAEDEGPVLDNQAVLVEHVLQKLWKQRSERRSPVGGPPVPWETVAPVLRRLAEIYLTHGLRSLEETGIERLAQKLNPDMAVRITDALIRDVGLLTRVRPGEVDFPFRVMAEHLVGRAIWDHVKTQESGKGFAALCRRRWAEEPVRFAVLWAKHQAGEARAAALIEWMLDGEEEDPPGFSAKHLRALLIALRTSAGLELPARTSRRLRHAAFRRILDETSVWVGDRVADAVRTLAAHAPDHTLPLLRSLARIASDRRTSPAAWYEAKRSDGPELWIELLYHRDPDVRSLANARLEGWKSEPDVLEWLFLSLDDEAYSAGGVAPAFAAAAVLRGTDRGLWPEGRLEDLRTRLATPRQLLAGAAAIILRPDEASPVLLARAFRSGILTLGADPAALLELAETPEGLAALESEWPQWREEAERKPRDLVHPGHPTWGLFPPPSSLVRERLWKAVGEWAVLHPKLSRYRRATRSAFLFQGAVRACLAIEQDPSAVDEFFDWLHVEPMGYWEPDGIAALARAARRHPHVADRLFSEWDRMQTQPRFMPTQYPGHALDLLVAAGDPRAARVLAEWLPASPLLSMPRAEDPIPAEILRVPAVRDAALPMARRAWSEMEALPLDRVAQSIQPNVLAVLWGAWEDDPDVRGRYEDWLHGKDDGRFLAALWISRRRPHDAETLAAVATRINSLGRTIIEKMSVGEDDNGFDRCMRLLEEVDAWRLEERCVEFLALLFEPFGGLQWLQQRAAALLARGGSSELAPRFARCAARAPAAISPLDPDLRSLVVQLAPLEHAVSPPVFFRGILTRSRWTAHSAASSPWRASTG